MFLHQVLTIPPSQPIGESANIHLSELMANSGNFDSSWPQGETNGKQINRLLSLRAETPDGVGANLAYPYVNENGDTSTYRYESEIP